MEHLNRIAKDTIRRSQIKHEYRQSLRSMGTIAPLLVHFDDENNVTIATSKYRKPLLIIY